MSLRKYEAKFLEELFDPGSRGDYLELLCKWQQKWVTACRMGVTGGHPLDFLRLYYPQEFWGKNWDLYQALRYIVFSSDINDRLAVENSMFEPEVIDASDLSKLGL